MSAFVSSRAKREYWVFTVATFLCFCSTSQLSLLSVILAQSGIPPRASGYVLSSWSVAAIGGTFVAGVLMSRVGLLPTAIAGLILTLVSFVSLQATYSFAVGAICSRLVAGFGFGLFIPAAVLYAKDRVRQDQQIYYTGIFSSSMMVPNLFSPAVGEWYVHTYGAGTYFLTMSLPILGGAIGCLIWLPHERHRMIPRADAGYFTLLREPMLAVPNLCVAITGMLWGFAATFLALWLREAGVLVAAFFTPFAIGMLTTRFLLLRLLQPFSARSLVAAGMALMVLSYVLLAITINEVSTGLAAFAFAVGYAVVYPTAVVWTSNLFTPDLRSRPVALVNAVFNIGGVITPILGGYLIPIIGFSGNALVLVLLAASVIVPLVMGGAGPAACRRTER